MIISKQSKYEELYLKTWRFAKIGLEMVVDCLHSRHVKFAHIWSYYGYIMLHNIVTNPRSHTQYHNQIIHNLLSTYKVETCKINHPH